MALRHQNYDVGEAMSILGLEEDKGTIKIDNEAEFPRVYNNHLVHV